MHREVVVCALTIALHGSSLPLQAAEQDDGLASLAREVVGRAVGLPANDVEASKHAGAATGTQQYETQYLCVWDSPPTESGEGARKQSAGRAHVVLEMPARRVVGLLLGWAAEPAVTTSPDLASQAASLALAIRPELDGRLRLNCVASNDQRCVYDWHGRDGDVFTGDRVLLMLRSSDGALLAYLSSFAPPGPVDFSLQRDAAWSCAKASLSAVGIEAITVTSERKYLAYPAWDSHDPAYCFQVRQPDGRQPATMWVVVNARTGSVHCRWLGARRRHSSPPGEPAAPEARE